MSESSLRSRMKNLLLFVPNLVLLCGRLMVDPRVPTKERVLVAGAIIYAFMETIKLAVILPPALRPTRSDNSKVAKPR